MAINIREDIAFLILDKIDRAQAKSPDRHLAVPVEFGPTDFAGRRLTEAGITGHLDYLNQRGYLDANFSGDPYGDRGPNPLPSPIELKSASLTDKGRYALKRMRQRFPEGLQKGPSVSVADRDAPFLEKVALRGNLSDIFDARDVTTVVFRALRDLMTVEAADRVEQAFGDADALPPEKTDNKSLQVEIGDLWRDTNPLTSFLSKIRPPLWPSVDAEDFLFRITNEGGLPSGTNAETVVKAVFSATKDELPPERCRDIAGFLPGRVREIWKAA